jgi:poly(3-hydroxybutyrate) depolymerase
MSIGLYYRIVLALALTSIVSVPSLAADPMPLPSTNAAIGESSISGISSGAYMAVQFATAWSSVIKGVGVIAGGPYWCAKADADDFINGYTLPILTATGPCESGPPSDLSVLIAKADAEAAADDIDALVNLARQKVYLFHGTNDAVVARSVTDAAAAFYRHYLGEASRGNLYYQTAIGAGHSLVVRQQPGDSGINECNANQVPYINRCGYDQAGILLQHIYGALNPPNRGALTGTMVRFDQSIYAKGGVEMLSLGDTGYVFVPRDCADGHPCRVHIALHGCKQDTGDLGRVFVDDTGYNAWADTNHLIVLYPQTQASAVVPFNPDACWDWWSYVDHEDSYITKSGAQIKVIKAMLDALTAHAAPVTAAAASLATTPNAVAVIDTSDTAADLVWSAVDGATAYRVARAGADGKFAAIGTVARPGFGDSGLAAGSAYRWRVTAIVNDVEGPASSEVTATTHPTPPPCGTPGTCPVGGAL